MKVGIIGYGSMGKMMLWKFSQAGIVGREDLYVSNRTEEKLREASDIARICSNKDLASACDIVFICVRPVDIGGILEEIRDDLKKDSLVISLNGSITFEMLETKIRHKLAKVIPSVTAEINKSQTLVSYNGLVNDEDKNTLKELLACIGDVIELPEDEMGMGSELVSCMPGFIASIFDVVCQSAKKHTDIPYEQVVKMVLNTMSATGDLMLRNDMSFEDVVTRVATKGGITQEGTKVVYEMFPETADKLFENTLAKRHMTAENAKKNFG